MNDIRIKLNFIEGLQEIVLAELVNHPQINVITSTNNSVYIENNKEVSEIILKLKSITRAFFVRIGKNLNPKYISSHKSLLGEMIDLVLNQNKYLTYTISCAGKQTAEVVEINSYIQKHYKLEQKQNADIKISIGKNEMIWELAVEMTSRPLSQRSYREINLEGALDPTIAFAMNTLCDLNNNKKYLNIFSGSATLLIEAAQINPNMTYIGFDKDKQRTSAAIQNIKKAKLIKTIRLSVSDIFDNPDFGTFDIIVSDLPFGMRISKDQDLKKLYSSFIDYCKQALSEHGILAVYTTEHELFTTLLEHSKFIIKKTIPLKLISSVNSYLYPKIFICTYKTK